MFQGMFQCRHWLCRMALVVAFALGLTACNSSAPDPPHSATRSASLAPEATSIPAQAQQIIVTSISDGDSFMATVPTAGSVPQTTSSVRFRLLQVDAPELNGEHGRPDCMANEAKNWLAETAPPGSKLWITTDNRQRDRFNRYLVYAWTATGVFINDALVRGGYARILHIRPNNQHLGSIRAAESHARAEHRGIWACSR